MRSTALDQYGREFRGSKLWSSQVAIVLATSPTLEGSFVICVTVGNSVSSLSKLWRPVWLN